MTRKTTIKPPQQTIQEIERQLKAIDGEIRQAMANYCLFRAAAVDKVLLERLGSSRATTAFMTVRDSLHKECVMSLMRVWDNTKKGNLSIEHLLGRLQADAVIEEIKKRRVAARVGSNFRVFTEHEGDDADAVNSALDRVAAHDGQVAAKKVDKEIKECRQLAEQARRGEQSESKKMLEVLRHRRVAHHEIEPPHDRPPDTRKPQIGDERILLELSMKLVEKLNMPLNESHVDLQDFTGIWRRMSASFWHSVRGEQADDWIEIKDAILRVYPECSDSDLP